MQGYVVFLSVSPPQVGGRKVLINFNLDKLRLTTLKAKLL